MIVGIVASAVVSHPLIPFGVDVRGDGAFDTTTPGWTGWRSQQLSNVVSQAHGAGVRVVLTIEQFDEATINQIVTDPAVTGQVFAALRELSARCNLPLIVSAYRYCPEGMQGVESISTELARAEAKRNVEALKG